MHAVVGLVAYNACFLGAGYGVLALLGRRGTLADAGLAFLLGVVVLLILMSVLATWGYVARIPVFLAATAACAIPAAIRLRRLAPPRLALRFPFRRPRWSDLPVAVFSVAVAVYAFVLLRVATVKPLAEWDAWAMWTMKAKALIVYGNLGVADFVGAAHPDYPLLVPMLQAFAFRFMGQINTELVHVEYALLVLAFAAAVCRVVSLRVGLAAASAWALYVLLLPGLEVNVPDALGDVPVAVFASLAAFAFALWLRDRRRAWLGMYSIFGAGAVWSKNEGLSALVVIAVLGVLLSIARPLARNIVPPLLASVAIYVLLLPWTFWTNAQGIGHDRNLTAGLHPSLLVREHARAIHSLEDLWSQLGNADTWLFLPYLTVLLVVVALIRRTGVRVALFSLLVPIGLLGSYVVVYTISTDPLGLDWYLATSSSRVITSVGLIAATLLPVQILTLVETADAEAPAAQPFPSTWRTREYDHARWRKSPIVRFPEK